jgi:endonuclease G
VIDSAEIAAATVIEFNYQVGSDGRMEPTARYRLMADTYFAGNRQSLDYCLVRVLPDHRNPPIISWNYLPINPHADPIVQERVIIVQHPNGGPKQIAMTHNQVLEVREPNLRYTTDTLPGSSGSPVFNESWQVIAIHCRRTPLKTPAGQPARFVNEGTLMSSIQADAGLRLPTIPHEPMSP